MRGQPGRRRLGMGQRFNLLLLPSFRRKTSERLEILWTVYAMSAVLCHRPIGHVTIVTQEEQNVLLDVMLSSI